MKKLAIIISLIVFSFSILFFIVPKESFSELENRSLEILPKLKFEDVINGKYMAKIETYISDHFPLKKAFLYIKTSLFKIIGFKDINDVYFGSDDFLIENYPQIDYKDELIKTLNDFKNNIDVNIHLMIVPTKIMLLEDKLPKNSSYVDQESEIAYIYKNIEIPSIDVLKVLESVKDKNELFYRTDHHWTSIGAYYGYKSYMESLNKSYLDLKDLKQKELTNSFLGSTYSKVTNYNQKNDKIFIFEFDNDLNVNYVLEKKEEKTLYNLDYLNKKDKYSLFLDNNHGLIEITNNKVENDNVLIIKDSFANSMIPLLVNHYHKISVIDPRYYKKSISKYIQENDIEEVLIIYNYGILATDKNVLSIR